MRRLLQSTTEPRRVSPGERWGLSLGWETAEMYAQLSELCPCKASRKVVGKRIRLWTKMNTIATQLPVRRMLKSRFGIKQSRLRGQGYESRKMKRRIASAITVMMRYIGVSASSRYKVRQKDKPVCYPKLSGRERRSNPKVDQLKERGNPNHQPFGMYVHRPSEKRAGTIPLEDEFPEPVSRASSSPTCRPVCSLRAKPAMV